MLSFEMTTIDIILMLMIIVLLILYITQKPTKSAAEPESTISKEKSAENPPKTIETQEPTEEGRMPTHPQTSSLECPHHFGYLKKLPKDAPIPDECFRCPRMADCFCK